MGNLAGLLLQLGYSGQPEQFDKAEKYCKGALEIIGAGKDKRRQSYLLGSLGNIYLHKKDLDKAWDNYNQSLGFMAELGDISGGGPRLFQPGQCKTLARKIMMMLGFSSKTHWNLWSSWKTDLA